VRTFQLAEDERELLREHFTASRDRKQVPNSKLILTDRRLALLVPRPDGVSKLFGMLWGRGAGKLGQKLELVHEIPRARFEVIEQDGPMLVFRNDQDGYAHVSFEVYEASPLPTWEQRLRDWVAGDHEAVARSG
jgi:hypothetical protein